MIGNIINRKEKNMQESKSYNIMKTFKSELRKEKLKIKVERLKNLDRNYSCRGCLKLTNKIYKVKKIKIIACCPDCARDVVECIKDKRPWMISPKIQKQMSKEQLERHYRFWVPIDRVKWPDIISKEFKIKNKTTVEKN